jgi:hypothetical protein
MALRRGLTTGEALTALAVLLLFAAILVPIYRRWEQKQHGGLDVVQLKRVYAGVTLYQEDHSDSMPSHLAELTGYVDPQELVSPVDPFAGTSSQYPIEPTLPDFGGMAESRISYAYLGNYLRANQATVKSWKEATMPIGMLANVWHGAGRRTGRFSAEVQGPVQRIRMDGSLYVLPRKASPSLSDFEDLFTRTEKAP